MTQLKVGILFGGKSGEHEVSIKSASSIMRFIDKQKYKPIPLGIKKNGKLATTKETKEMLPDDLKDLVIDDFPLEKISFYYSQEEHFIDVLFPVLHGPNGEDGTIQGWMELLDIPYVGSGVVGSATGMDKEIMKRIYSSHQLPIIPYYTLKKIGWDQDQTTIIKEIEEELTYPLFVKPANMGSSVGISKAHDQKELIEGIQFAFKYDRKLVIEQGLSVREIEVSILGNEDPKASVPGEIIPCNEFYDYNAKYIDDKSELIIPAKLDDITIKSVQENGKKAFMALDCFGLARVDFLIDKSNNAVYINEINTMPGFTNISMYPKLWEKTGISYPDLIDQLIQLGIKRFENKVNPV